MPAIDFAALRASLSMLEVLNLLGFVPLSRCGDQRPLSAALLFEHWQESFFFKPTLPATNFSVSSVAQPAIIWTYGTYGSERPSNRSTQRH